MTYRLYLQENFPFYTVTLDGKPWKTFCVNDGRRLTWSQQDDIINGFREAFDDN